MSNFRCQILKSLFNWEFQRGFTVIELLVVIVMISILTLSSVITFSSYSRSQTYQTSVGDVVALINKAKSRAFTQVKPPQCNTTALQSYQVAFTVPGQDYQLRVLCGGITYTVESKRLPSQVQFATGSSTSVSFRALRGTVPTPATIRITGFGNTRIITVDGVGNIAAQ